MRSKIVWLAASCLIVVALLAVSCAPASEKEVAPVVPAVKETAPVVPAVKETAPVVKEAAPVEEKPRYGGVFRYGTGGNPQGWDNANMFHYEIEGNVGGLSNEELMTGDWTKGPAGTNEMDTTIRLVDMRYQTGALAESFEFPDNQTIIFHIRKGVRWALNPNSEASRLVNGRELTADDVAFYLKRIYMEIVTAPMYGYAGTSRPLDIYAKDKYTLVVKNAPGQQGYTWEYMAAWTGIFPPEVIKKYGDHTKWENIVGTGPFMLTDYISMSSVTFKRNPNYWGINPIGPGKGDQLPYFDEVKRLIIPDASTMQAAMRTGKIDYNLGSFNVEDSLSLMQTAPQLKFVSYLPDSYSTIGWRMDNPDLPWAPQDSVNALKVRRALWMAIDNQALLDTFHKGQGELLMYKVFNCKAFQDAYTPLDQLPPSPDGFDTRKLYGYYPEEAKKLLAEAGYPNGFKAEIVVTGAGAVDQVTVVKAMWAKIGVDLRIDVKESAVRTAIFNAKTYSQMIYGGRSGNPYGMWLVRKGDPFNTSFVNDPRVEEAYAQFGPLYFSPEKAKIMKELSNYLNQQAYYFVFPTGKTYRFWQPWLKNYHGEIDTGWYNFKTWMKYAWLDPELKKSMGF